jgi:hypothetical protein
MEKVERDTLDTYMNKEALQVAVFFIFILGGGLGFLLARFLF